MVSSLIVSSASDTNPVLPTCLNRRKQQRRLLITPLLPKLFQCRNSGGDVPLKSAVSGLSQCSNISRKKQKLRRLRWWSQNLVASTGVSRSTREEGKWKTVALDWTSIVIREALIIRYRNSLKIVDIKVLWIKLSMLIIQELISQLQADLSLLSEARISWWIILYVVPLMNRTCDLYIKSFLIKLVGIRILHNESIRNRCIGNYFEKEYWTSVFMLFFGTLWLHDVNLLMTS